VFCREVLRISGLVFILNRHELRFDSYEGVTKSFRTESITQYKLTTINTR
jgi:hypothetical protein